MKAADDEYGRRNWDQARKLYEQLAREHPSHRLAAQAKFLAELSALRQATTSVMSRTDPSAGIAEWNKFMANPALGEFGAKGRFQTDVWEAGTKLEEDVLAKAADTFNADNPDESEKWLTEAAELDRAVDRFRDEQVPKNERLAAGLAELRGKIDTARVVLAQLAELNKFAGEGPDVLERFDQEAMRLGLSKHPAVVARRAEAEQQIQSKAVYTREPNPIPPTAVPDDGLTSLLFAPRFDNALPRQLSGPAGVFFCQARGVLYALGEENGQRPVGRPHRARHRHHARPRPGVGPESGNGAGRVEHRQPVRHHRPRGPRRPAALAPVPRRPVPGAAGPRRPERLRRAWPTPTGTVLEIDAGDRRRSSARSRIGRPLGPVVVARPGTGLLYIPGDAHAVYVFDVDRHDPDGRRLEPTLLGVMNTGHPRGSLRGVPVFSNPDPNEPGPKFLVLGQADGLDTMKLRAFRLPDGPDPRPAGDVEAKEIPIPGWASFPPHCDGEKVAVVTDKGQFGLYGLALSGNPADDNLFAFPAKPERPGEVRPSRGQVVHGRGGHVLDPRGRRIAKVPIRDQPDRGRPAHPARRPDPGRRAAPGRPSERPRRHVRRCHAGRDDLPGDGRGQPDRRSPLAPRTRG